MNHCQQVYLTKIIPRSHRTHSAGTGLLGALLSVLAPPVQELAVLSLCAQMAKTSWHAGHSSMWLTAATKHSHTKELKIIPSATPSSMILKLLPLTNTIIITVPITINCK